MVKPSDLTAHSWLENPETGPERPGDHLKRTPAKTTGHLVYQARKSIKQTSPQPQVGYRMHIASCRNLHLHRSGRRGIVVVSGCASQRYIRNAVLKGMTRTPSDNWCNKPPCKPHPNHMLGTGSIELHVSTPIYTVVSEGA